MDQKTKVSFVRTTGGWEFLAPDWMGKKSEGALMLGWKDRTEVAIIQADRIDCMGFEMESLKAVEALFVPVAVPEVDDGTK